MEIQQIENQLSTLSDERITAEILIYKDQVGYGMIELGKRLIEMKKRLGHGKFLDYLANEVEFSRMTANNFIRMAEQEPNVKTFLHLGVSKIYALLDVPTEDREDFITTTHQVETKNGIVEKTVEQMTVREVEQVIKLQKELAEKDKLLQQEKETQSLLNRRINNINNDLMETQKAKDKYLTELNEKDKTIRKLKAEVKTEIIYEESPELQKALWEAEQKANELNEKLRNAEGKLHSLQDVEEKKQEIEEVYKKLEKLKLEQNKFHKNLDSLNSVYKFITKTKSFVKEELLHIPTLTLPPDNKSEVFLKDISLICETLDNFTFAIRNQFLKQK